MGYADLQQAVAEAAQGTQRLEIVVPSAKLKHTVYPTPWIYDGNLIEGMLAESARVPASSFGTANQPMDRVVVELLDLPDNWGDWKLTYHTVLQRTRSSFRRMKSTS